MIHLTLDTTWSSSPKPINVVAVKTSEIKGGFIQEVAVKKEIGQLKR